MSPFPSGPYCLLHRGNQTTLVTGKIHTATELARMPRPAAGGAPLVVSMVPYAQIRERGFLTHDGGEPILSLVAERTESVDLDTVAGTGDNERAIEIAAPIRYSMSDADLIQKIGSIIDQEIRNGEGSNFLFSRKSYLTLKDFDQRTARTLFRRLARNEFGAYLTFCFFDGTHTFIGSSPERHITVEGRVVKMNPICGTLPKKTLTSRGDLIAFLSDPKEVNELFQVVDEELKMMSRICSAGGEVQGPYLKEMSHVIHTEYLLQGQSTMDVVDAFRQSMFAATMVGSPLENAARIIYQHETESRRYYSSALVLHSLDATGADALDSAITIRTMEVDAAGNCVLQTGASIVRDSIPEKECQEIKAKAEGMLRAITSSEAPTPVLARYRDTLVDQVLESRNKVLSRFWLREQSIRKPDPRLRSTSILIIDNEDEFTFMLKHVFDHLGAKAVVRNYDDPALRIDDADLVVVGPGPGDPTDASKPKMAAGHRLLDQLLASDKRFMAVCLGHQMLCHRLGMPIVKNDPPLQGVQKTIELFGRSEPCGFYNTFFAVAPAQLPDGVEVACEPDNKVNAIRAPRYVGFQFHLESILTTNGLHILNDALAWLLR